MKSANVVLNMVEHNGQLEQEAFEKFLLVGVTKNGLRCVVSRLSDSELSHCVATAQAKVIQMINEDK
jgi:hypothetical protein